MQGLAAADVWPHLNDTSAWPGCYEDVSDIRFHDGLGPTPRLGARFRFMTFGFSVEAGASTSPRPRPAGADRMARSG
ncbi:hypothetical protein X946_5245 [Burkholderia sp. ABCPW 111]|nr:hypothetical protein X946_5245 [Burkholderia sp. ABCPW 111]